MKLKKEEKSKIKRKKSTKLGTRDSWKAFNNVELKRLYSIKIDEELVDTALIFLKLCATVLL